MILFLVNMNVFANEKDIFNLGQPIFKSIGDKKEIPYGIVTAITQDHQGFLWIGTQHGLIRYDGYQFHKFSYSVKDKNSISGDYISALFVASDGKIWIGTTSDGISVYNPSTDTFQNYKNSKNDSNSLSNNHINTIIADKDNTIWVGTNHGLNAFHLNSDKISHFYHLKDTANSLNDNRITALHLDSSNAIWVGTGNGLNKIEYKPHNKSFNVSVIPQLQTKLKGTLIDEIFQSTDNKIWLGTKTKGAFWFNQNYALTQIKANTKNLDFLLNSWILSIIQANENEIWLGSYSHGIIVISTDSGKVIRHITHDKNNPGSISLNEISAFHIDKSGLIWIGTWGGSLNMLNPINKAFKTITHSLINKNIISYPNISTMLELNSGLIWVGTRGNGIDIIDPKRGLINKIRPYSNEKKVFFDGVIMSMAQETDGTIWIGTRQTGLFKYLPKTHSLKRYTTESGLIDNNIRKIMPTKTGKLWLATSAGINRFNPATERFETFTTQSEPNKQIQDVFNSLAQQKDGTIWAGSHGGLYVLLPGNKHFIHITHDDKNNHSISHNNIPGLLVDSKNQVWVDTRYGLNKLKKWQGKSSVFESINTYMGRTGLYFGGNLLEDNQGRIWTQWFMVNPKDWQLQKSPISSESALGTPWLGSFMKTRLGTLVYGGTKGLLLIKPEQYQKWAYQPPLRVSNLKVNGKNIPSENIKALSLAPHTKSLYIEFSSLDFSNPHNIEYSYKLEGYDTDWSFTDSDHRTLNYTNLDPGKYTLHIRGTNKNGIWSPNEFSMTINQQPAWFQTTWFKMVAWTLFLLLIYAIVKLRIQRLKAQKTVLEQRVQQKTADILLLSDIGKELTSRHNFEDVLTQVYEKINKVLDANVLLLGILQKDKNTVHASLIIENNIRVKPINFDLTDNNYPAAWCINNKKELIISTPSDIKKYFQNQIGIPKSGKEMKTIVYLPLIIRNKLMGCLSIQSLKTNAYSDEQISMIRTLASYTAISTANTLGYQKLVLANKKLKSAHKELKNVCQDLEAISLTDQLTGAHNRRFLNKFIGQELAKVQRDHYKKPDKSQSGFGFILIDLDHFKYINDTFGHDAGDKVLIQVVKVITQTCRDFDWVIRWGGEEFLVVSRFIQRAQMGVLAERIRANIEAYEFDLGEGRTIHRTCSMGIAGFPFITKQVKALIWEQTLQLADLALYAVKNNGRNGWISLFENHIEDVDEFYSEAVNHLDHLIEKGDISFETSLDKSKIVFNTPP
ncbi:two-component regulator propeller domain-containing protein [Pseudoalteromonas denitrificans]|uniref:two-component regulator propeller domain-containing protein n=1 Tax=Pseudoalteromonas denitrificans TaxID=43656 RepID=UPI0015A6E4D9|nr:two-component regulator propeller domain-containing protein [Pseudoalteromonas denitrificans]